MQEIKSEPQPTTKEISTQRNRKTDKYKASKPESMMMRQPNPPPLPPSEKDGKKCFKHKLHYNFQQIEKWKKKGKRFICGEYWGQVETACNRQY